MSDTLGIKLQVVVGLLTWSQGGQRKVSDAQELEARGRCQMPWNINNFTVLVALIDYC